MERLVIFAALCALAVASDYSMFTAGDLLTTGAKTFTSTTTIHVAALQSVDFAQHVTVELGMESQPLSALLTNGYGYFSFSTYSSVKFSLTTVIPSQSVVFFLSSWSDDAPVVYTPANMTSSAFTMLNVDSRSVVLLQPSATSQFPELLLKTVAVSGSATVTSYTKNGGADLFTVGNSDFANWDNTTVYGAVIMISTDCNNCYSTSTSSATFVATWQTNDYGSYDRIVRPQQSGIVMAPCYKSGNCTSGKQRVRLASDEPISYRYNQILKFTLQSSSVDAGRGTLTIGNENNATMLKSRFDGQSVYGRILVIEYDQLANSDGFLLEYSVDVDDRQPTRAPWNRGTSGPVGPGHLSASVTSSTVLAIVLALSYALISMY